MFKITIEGDDSDPRMVSILAILAGTNQTVNGMHFAPTGTEPDDDDTAAPATPGDPNERDANGLPWDERIHSKSRAKVAGNLWRKRKGVAPDLVTSVEAELRARGAAANPTPPVAPAAPATPPPSAPASMPEAGAPPPPTTGTTAPTPASPSEPAPAIAPPAAPPAAPAPVAAVAGAPADFGSFMEIISKSMGANLIDNQGQFLTWLCAQPDVAVSQITEIANDAGKLAAAYNHLVAQKRIAP